MKRFLVFCYCLAIIPGAFGYSDFWYPVEGPEARRILVPGTIPLTLGDRNVFFNCLEFGMGIALTYSEQERIQYGLMNEFLVHKNKLLDSLQEISRIWEQILESSPDEKGKFQHIIKNAIMKEVCDQPGLELSGTIREILKNANETLISGYPEINKRTVAAFGEIVQFALMLRDKKHANWDEAATAAFTGQIAKIIPNLSPEGRHWLSNADFHRSIIQRNWSKTPSDEKEAIRRFISETFAPGNNADPNLKIDLTRIMLPPPNFFPLPTDLPWRLR